MKIISSKNKLIRLIHKERNLGFVPTMGAIHKGHISLIKKCIFQCNKTIVSIFVNKPQFNKINDFRKYPRFLNEDINKLKKLKVNYLYLPTNAQIYPNGINKNIKINSFGKKLCGKFRPKHFESVVDVIDRFIKIIKPKKIYFGEKDMQQLKIIENFVKRNYLKIRIVGCKTVRERNGIACSSRNFLLSQKDKKIASKIFKFLCHKKRALIKNIKLIKNFKKKILDLGASKVDYIQLLDINKIMIPRVKKNKYKIFVAYYLRTTRLIDNI
tara:strand:- start:115 stop:924 length:810 start_codon:yes stop_codon:yes gene_type:complete